MAKVTNHKELEYPVLLFDGVCNVCNTSVQFILKRDDSQAIRFASLQSEIAHELMSKYNLSPNQLDTIVFIDKGTAYIRSDAALRALKYLKMPWPVFSIFLILPRFIRDFFYNLVANNRYRWFGKQEVCMVPTPEVRSRFIDQ